MRTLALITVLLTSSLLHGQDGKVLLRGGIAHLGNGQMIKNSLIGMEGGKLTLVRNALTLTINEADWDTIIDISGKHVYPGFILTDNTLGLVEIDAVRATRDFVETGSINPNVRALIAYNTDSDIIPTVRQNGVMVTQCTPRGGLISGTSSMLRTQAWNWEDGAIHTDDGVHVNWPRKDTPRHNHDDQPEKKQDSYLEYKQKLDEFFTEAKAYLEEEDHEEQDLRLEAMRGVFDGQKRLYIHVQYAPEIQDVIEMQRKFKFTKPVIVGGYDAWMVGEILKDLQIPVILTRLHSLPRFAEDPVDHVYSLAAKLKEAGVDFCLGYEGDMEAMGSRNLPFVAGTAAAYGLAYEDAVEAITLAPARITGIDASYGSLEKGKSATLIVSEGDALDMKSNRISMARIDGKTVDLSSRQLDLYNKYRSKYQQESVEEER